MSAISCITYLQSNNFPAEYMLYHDKYSNIISEVK